MNYLKKHESFKNISIQLNKASSIHRVENQYFLFNHYSVVIYVAQLQEKTCFILEFRQGDTPLPNI